MGGFLRFKCLEVEEWIHGQDKDKSDEDSESPGRRKTQQKNAPQAAVKRNRNVAG